MVHGQSLAGFGAREVTIAKNDRYQPTPLQCHHNEHDGVSVICSIVCSGADHRKHQSSASLAFVRGMHRWPVDSPKKGPVTRNKFPFDDVIMKVTKQNGNCVYSFIYTLFQSITELASMPAFVCQRPILQKGTFKSWNISFKQYIYIYVHQWSTDLLNVHLQLICAYSCLEYTFCNVFAE